MAVTIRLRIVSVAVRIAKKKIPGFVPRMNVQADISAVIREITMMIKLNKPEGKE